MNAQYDQQGPTLPLFPDQAIPDHGLPNRRRGSGKISRAAVGRSETLLPPGLPIDGDSGNGTTAVAQDLHMQAAWQLAQRLRLEHTGRPAGSKPISARQRRQAGVAICEHLLASLRIQVSLDESQQATH